MSVNSTISENVHAMVHSLIRSCRLPFRRLSLVFSTYEYEIVGHYSSYSAMSWCKCQEYWMWKQVINLAIYVTIAEYPVLLLFHSLRNLICAGSEERTFDRVTLLNEGVDAYRQDMYGNCICGYEILAKNREEILILNNKYRYIIMIFFLLLYNLPLMGISM